MNRAVAAARVLCIAVMGIFFSSRPRDYSNLSRAFRNDFGRPISDDFILSRRVYNLTAAVPNRFQGLTHTHTYRNLVNHVFVYAWHTSKVLSRHFAYAIFYSFSERYRYFKYLSKVTVTTVSQLHYRVCPSRVYSCSFRVTFLTSPLYCYCSRFRECAAGTRDKTLLQYSFYFCTRYNTTHFESATKTLSQRFLNCVPRRSLQGYAKRK